MNLFTYKQDNKVYIVDVEGNCYSSAYNIEDAVHKAVERGIPLEDIDIN